MTTRPLVYPGFAALLVLAGCVTVPAQPTPPAGPFPGAADVGLGSSAEPVREGEAAAGAPDVFRLTLPAELANTNGLLYAEVAGAAGTPPDALTVTLYDSAGAALLTSRRADFFTAAEATPARPVAPQAVTVRPICRGPCVLTPTPPTPDQEDVFYVEVESAQDAAYSLYLFTDAFADTNEPANNDRNTAVTVAGSETGALEAVGDEDFYRSSAAATGVSLESGAAALALRAEIFLEDGTPVTSVPAGTPFTSALAPQRFLVRVYSDARRAAVAGSSTYALTFE